MKILCVILLLLPSLFAFADNNHNVTADSVLLKKHVYALTDLNGYRNIEDTAALAAAARYITVNLKKLQRRYMRRCIK